MKHDISSNFTSIVHVYIGKDVSHVFTNCKVAKCTESNCYQFNDLIDKLFSSIDTSNYTKIDKEYSLELLEASYVLYSNMSTVPFQVVFHQVDDVLNGDISFRVGDVIDDSIDDAAYTLSCYLG